MGDGVTTHPNMLPQFLSFGYGWMSLIPAVFTFLGGVILPTTGIFLNLGLGGNESTLALAGACAIGAALGDIVMHLVYGNANSFSVTAKRAGMDFLYAGFAAFVAMLGMSALGVGEFTGQYLTAGIAGAAVYFMGRMAPAGF